MKKVLVMEYLRKKCYIRNLLKANEIFLSCFCDDKHMFYISCMQLVKTCVCIYILQDINSRKYQGGEVKMFTTVIVYVCFHT